MPWVPGQSGNPGGRIKGSIGRLSQEARELAASYGYDPLEKQILLAKKLENLITRNHFPDILDRLRHFEALAGIYKATTPYLYPQLKSVEHSGTVRHAEQPTPEERRERIAFLLDQVGQLASDEARATLNLPPEGAQTAKA